MCIIAILAKFLFLFIFMKKTNKQKTRTEFSEYQHIEVKTGLQTKMA